MILLKVLILILMFNEHVARLKCPKGHKVSSGGNKCENCPPDYYQDSENDSKSCRPCTKCESELGSEVKEECTLYANRKCQCRENFIKLDSDSSICKCPQGFGLGSEEVPQCLKCEKGFFTPGINRKCQKWKPCKWGEKSPGTEHLDVICNEPNSNASVTTPLTTNKISSLTRLITRRPHEGAQTQGTHTSSTTTVTSKGNKNPTHTSNTGNHIGMGLLIFGIAGLLVLSAVTCKLHITDYFHRKDTVSTKDSLCRRPIEESCFESQSQDKLNTGEP